MRIIHVLCNEHLPSLPEELVVVAVGAVWDERQSHT